MRLIALDIAEQSAMNMTKPLMPKNEKQYMFRLSTTSEVPLAPPGITWAKGFKCKNLKLAMTPPTSVAMKAIAQLSTKRLFFFILKNSLNHLSKQTER